MLGILNLQCIHQDLKDKESKKKNKHIATWIYVILVVHVANTSCLVSIAVHMPLEVWLIARLFMLIIATYSKSAFIVTSYNGLSTVLS